MVLLSLVHNVVVAVVAVVVHSVAVVVVVVVVVGGGGENHIILGTFLILATLCESRLGNSLSRWHISEIIEPRIDKEGCTDGLPNCCGILLF